MALLDEMRTRIRVITDATDAEIDDEINAAIWDMRRCGVKESLLNDENPHPLVKHAITLWVKAHYGLDNHTERPQFIEAYKCTLCDLLNSKANEYLFPETTGATDDQTGNDGGSTGDSGGDG